MEPVIGLNEQVAKALQDLKDRFCETLGPDLVSLVLFGSAAEGRLRLTSDVNLIVVVSDFRSERFEPLQPHILAAESSIALRLMILREEEISPAAELFSVKFQDILHRHRLLFGKDVFAGLKVPRDALLNRARQTLLNQMIRLRTLSITRIAHSEQLVPLIADTAGPLRASAATLCELRGEAVTGGKAALEKIMAEILGSEGTALASRISYAREYGILSFQEAKEVLNELSRVIEAMYREAQHMR